MTTSTAMLPAPFADLEPYAAKWCLATEGERYAARLAGSMDEMEAFYLGHKTERWLGVPAYARS